MMARDRERKKGGGGGEEGRDRVGRTSGVEWYVNTALGLVVLDVQGLHPTPLASTGGSNKSRALSHGNQILYLNVFICV